MAQPERIVERLRLRAGSQAAVRLALPRLEDAFRTASLPDAGARLMFVRRLDLGRLPAAASAQTLALALEARFAQAGWRLVHAGEAGAGEAEAVWLLDAFEAHALAAESIAAGRPVDAWFWPLAVPALAGTATAQERLRAIAFSLAGRDEAPAALPLWVARLARAGHAQQLIAALRPGDGAALLRAASGDARPSLSARQAQTEEADGDPYADSPPLRPGGGGGGTPPRAAPDDRREFVEIMAARAPGHPTQRRLVASTAGKLRPAAGAPTGTASPPRRASPADAPRAAEPSPAVAPPAASITAREATPCERLTTMNGAREPCLSAPPVQRADPPDLAIVATPIGETRAEEATTSDGAPGYAAPSAAGGLLFLVPLIERLGFGEWWAAAAPRKLRAPGALAGQVFHLLLARLALAEQDPAWRLCSPIVASGGVTAGQASPEGILARADLACLPKTTNRQFGPRGARWAPMRIAGSAPLAHAWLAACRRLARRRARIGLASLVMRPARLALTETHADVFFAASAADLRVRRAGLDIDPGWVPWLGRVVSFHYEDRRWT
jgi:hypothetical protein